MSNSSFTSTDQHLSFNDFLDNILVDFPSQNSVLLSCGSDNSTRNTDSWTSGSNDGETTNPADERKRKRLMSNRDSARRSRMRKQKHLENLTDQVIRYEKGNQELMKRLRFLNHNGQMIQKENQRLLLEVVRLQQKLRPLLNYPELHHPLLPYAWPCNNNATTINDQNQPTLITF